MVEIPDNERADPFRYFDPSKEFGFPTYRLPKYRSNTVKNLTPLTTQEACSLFHNFNGVDVDMSITTNGLNVYGQPITPQDSFHVSAEYQGGVTLRNVVQPKQRYLGAIVNEEKYGFKSRSDGYCSVFAYVNDPTQVMYAFFNNEPVEGSMEGLRGFGMNIFGARINGKLSRAGGTFQQTIRWSNWDQEPDFGFYQVYNNKGELVTVNSWDGTYQKYLAAQEYERPDLKPDVVATINRIRKTLTDPNGQRISFTETTCTESVVAKDLRYNDEGEVVGVWKIPFPKANFSVTSGGRFFKYA